MYSWTNNPLEVHPLSIVNKFAPTSIPQKLKLILKDFAADFLRIFKSSSIPESKIWFLVLTQNNLDALKDVKEITPDSIYTSFYKFRSTIKENSTYYFYMPLRFFRNFLYPIYWTIYYFNNREKAKRYYDLLITVHGSYEEALRLLKKTKPKAIVFANDHLITARSILLAANYLGIKTYYVQHAAVSEFFPPLEFSHALLEGRDSQLKYKNCGEIKSQVHLCGMPKFDKYVNELNTKDKVEVVGLAFNQIDAVEDVFSFVSQLKKENTSLEIILRPHPGDDRNMDLLEKFTFSNSKVESVFSFLSKIDCLIAGESSIHLEAVLLNVYPLHFSFDKSLFFDCYAFIENKLIEHFSNVKELNVKLKELQELKPNVQYRAIPYNAAIGSDFYGRSAQKIAKIINDTLNN